MKKKLLLISVPILMSVLGLLIVQVSWIVGVFRQEFSSANEAGVIALKKGLEKFQTEKKMVSAKLLTQKFGPLADSIKIKYVLGYPDSLIVDLKDKDKGIPRLASAFRFNYHKGRVIIWFPADLIFSKDPTAQDSTLRSTAKDLFDKNDELANVQYTKADSLLIRGYIEKEMAALGKATLNPIIELNFRQTNNAGMLKNPLFNGTYYMEYKPSGLANYFGDSRYLAISFPTIHSHVAAKLVFLIMLSCFLTFLLIFSIVYLIKLILQQKQLAEMKDDFINNLTHEFKTPIATVYAAIEGLQKFNAINDKEKTERYLDISRTELNRLNDMVSKVLNISSYERKDLKLDKEKIDLEETVNEVTQMELVKGVKPVRFSVNISPDVKQLIADPLHIKNVLGNLIDNAVKYSKNEVDISITAYREKNLVAIKIKDNGIGIAAKDLKFIFDKFYRVTDGNLYNTKGNGLGLNYVRSIVEAHGGTIIAKSEINTGTEFIITLPLNNG